MISDESVCLDSRVVSAVIFLELLRVSASSAASFSS